VVEERIYKIQYINQKVVYIVVEDQIDMQLNISVKKLATSLLKSEYTSN
jgi:hypothetical protein